MQNPDELAGVIQRTRAAYFLERRNFHMRVHGNDRGCMPLPEHVARWDGGEDARGVRHASLWEKLARFALSRGVDPSHLIKAGFAFCDGTRAPAPNVFMSDAMVERAREHRKRTGEHLRLQAEACQREALVRFQVRKLARPEAEESAIWRDVLTDPTLTAGPLFRFALAGDLKQDDLVQGLWRSALLEYVQNPEEYDQFLKEFLSESFREAGRRWLADWLRTCGEAQRPGRRARA